MTTLTVNLRDGAHAFDELTDQELQALWQGAQRAWQMRIMSVKSPGITPALDLHLDGSTYDLKDRIRGAIWGQVVGDAAALGTHWIYNLSELETSFPEGVNGFETPRAGHYHAGKVPGDLTHYGEGALLLLESVAQLGRFDARVFGESFVSMFGGAGYTGYKDKATRGTLENYGLWAQEHGQGRGEDGGFLFQAGADDDQLATASRLACVVATHHSDPDLLHVVETCTRVTQNNERAVTYMKANAIILAELLHGRDPHTALHRAEELAVPLHPVYGPEVRRKIAAAMAASLKPVRDATLEFGQSCPLPSSFPSAIHAWVRHPESYPTCVLEVIRAGGDNAGRAAMAGAWFGASVGASAIPEEWKRRLNWYEKIHGLVESVVSRA